MGSYLDLLRQRDFRRILWATIPGRLAYAMVGLSVFFNAKNISGSLATAGLAIGANVFTSSTTAGLRGTAIDRWGQTKPLAILAPLYATTMVLLAFADLGPGWVVLLSGLNGCVAPPINLSARPLYRVAVGEEQLRTAFAFDAITNNLTVVVGPAIATALCLQISPRFSLCVTAGLMVAGGLALVTSPLSRAWQSEPRVEGAGRLFSVPGVWLLAIDAVFIGFAFGALDVAVPSAASLAHHPERAAWLLGTFALGNIFGGFWAGSNARRISARTGLIASTTTCAIFMLGLPFTHPDLWMGLLVLLAGISMGPAQVFMVEVIDLVRPPGAAVSAQGWLWSIEGGCAALGSTVAGSVAQHHGAATALSAVGLAAIGSPIALLLGRRSLVRHHAAPALALAD